jgi:hypothetical protein
VDIVVPLTTVSAIPSAMRCKYEFLFIVPSQFGGLAVQILELDGVNLRITQNYRNAPTLICRDIGHHQPTC